MPRRKVELPTFIYWLVDARTGHPFYCGKTIASINERLADHKVAAKAFPDRPVSIRLLSLGEDVRAQLIETVPYGQDWVARERYWIEMLRCSFPDCANMARGGEGAPGVIHSLKTREKFRLSHLGKKLPPGTGQKISIGNKGKKRTPEQLARMSTARKGETRSIEQRLKISASLKGRKFPRCPMKVKKAPMTEKHKAAISRSRKGKPLSAEHRASLSASHVGKKLTPEHAAKFSRAGTSMGLEQRQKISNAQKGRPLSEDHRAALKAAWARRKATRQLTISAICA